VRVLLVNVPAYASHLRGVPLGLLYIISSCRTAGREVELLDGGLFSKRPEFLKALFSREFDVLGLSAMTHNIEEALVIARLARIERPSARVVIGGAHASTVPEKVAEACPECDVMAGEGERSFPLYLDAVEGGAGFETVPGLYRYRDGRSEGTAPRAIENLDSLPFPAYDLVDFARYTVGVHGLFFKRKPLTSMVTSRGCPFKCSFCAKTALTGFTWRARSAENVLDEIELLTKRFGIREIHFEDDNMALEPRRLEAICEGMLKRGIDIAWKCPHGIYAPHLDAGMFALMRRSGCYSLSFGVESGNDELLRRAGKATTTGQIAKSIEAAHRAGIQCVGFFIFGLEGETAETVRQTIDFAKSLPLDAAQFNLCIPFEGTPIRQRYLELGYIGEDSLASYDVDHAVVDLPGLTAKQLKSWRLRAFAEFYARPSILVKNLRNVSSADVLKALSLRLRNIWRA
jgi:radical SAM superfamily enzyme YgiQ (UPF0313 family)